MQYAELETNLNKNIFKKIIIIQIDLYFIKFLG